MQFSCALCQHNGPNGHAKALHGLSQPPHAVELMACEAIDQPGKVAQGKEPGKAPVEGRADIGIVPVLCSARLGCAVLCLCGTQAGQIVFAQPPQHAEEEEEAEAGAHNACGAEDVQVEIEVIALA